MPDDSPQPQPATQSSPDASAKAMADDLRVGVAHVPPYEIVARRVSHLLAIADTIDRLLAEKARAEADALQAAVCRINAEIDEHDDYSRGGMRMARNIVRAMADKSSATLAATAPAATETKEQENAR